jgi:hypothetical protein
MTMVDLKPGEYRRFDNPKRPREPILAPYWWVGIIHIASLYLVSALGHWLFDRLF